MRRSGAPLVLVAPARPHSSAARALEPRMTRISAAAAIAIAVAITPSADAGVVRTQVARFADASGLLDRYAGAGLSRIGFDEPIVSVVRPDGIDMWQESTFGGLDANFTASQMDDWLSSRARGTWTISYEDGSSETFDTTPLWTPAADRVYGMLTASSVALWESIATQQLSGTFTFEMVQSVEELGCNGVQLLVGGGLGGVDGITTGRTFTVSIDGTGAAQGGFLSLNGFGVTGTVTGTGGYPVIWDSGFYTIYNAPIPAPGALALLGLALAPMRRSRHRK